MFCTNCGKEIPDGSRNCMYCGTAMKVVEPQDALSEATKETVVETVVETVTEVAEEAKETIKEEATEVSKEVEVAETVTEAATEVAAEVAKESESVKEVITEEAKDVAKNAVSEVVPQPIPQNIPVNMAVEPPKKAKKAKKEKKKKEKSEKSGGAGVVIAIIILVLILAGAGVGAYLFLNSPYNKIKKAIAENDITTVCELYSELNNDEQKEYVGNSMWNYVVDLESQYQDEKIDYDTAMADIKAINKSVLKNDKELKALIEDMDALNGSRTAYDTAEKAFKKGDYEKAYDNYALVIKDDSNYKKAQKQMEECLALMIPPVTGKYRLDFDMGDAFLEGISTGDTSQYTISMPSAMILEFNEDGTGSMYIDEDAMNAGLEQAMDDLVGIYYDLLEQETGLSKIEIDAMLYNAGYNSLEDMVKDEFDFSDYDVSALSATFTYEVNDEGDCITIVNDGQSNSRDIIYEMSGENIVITGGFFEDASSFGIDLPAEFVKID